MVKLRNKFNKKLQNPFAVRYVILTVSKTRGFIPLWQQQNRSGTRNN